MTGKESFKELFARARDVISLSEKHHCLKATDFLTPAEAAALRKENMLAYESKQEFFGGYEGAERVMFVSYPDYEESFEPEEVITLLEITGRDLGSLSHRDFLGSILGLGIKREKVGDILLFEEGAYVFVSADIASYIKDNLLKIGRCGAKIKMSENLADFSFERETEEIKGTVQSLRLDAVLAVALRLSRGKTLQYIESEKVFVNWLPQTSPSYNLKEGDIFSVRGFGKFEVFEVGGLTKKGRVGIILHRFK